MEGMVRRPPSRLSPSYFENAALHYLERFSSSSANLRRVLDAKAARSLAHWGGDRDEASAWIDAVLAKLARLGYLDDGAYARQQAASQHRAGRSERAIRARLAAKGVAAETVDAALDEIDDGPVALDLAAAIRLTRRRRMGPFRAEGAREAMRARDLAALGRAGFDYATARTVIDAADIETLDALETG
jgi:regulatory protein